MLHHGGVHLHGCMTADALFLPWCCESKTELTLPPLLCDYLGLLKTHSNMAAWVSQRQKKKKPETTHRALEARPTLSHSHSLSLALTHVHIKTHSLSWETATEAITAVWTFSFYSVSSTKLKVDTPLISASIPLCHQIGNTVDSGVC